MSSYNEETWEYTFYPDDRFSDITVYQEWSEQTYAYDALAPSGDRIKNVLDMAHIANGLAEQVAALEAEVRRLEEELYDRELAKAKSTRQVEAIFDDKH